MTEIIECGQRSGCISAPSSKSYAHRALILVALGKRKTDIICNGISKDIQATASCLNSLGADIRISGGKISVIPISKAPSTLLCLHCGESGSTLRFLIPIAGALGLDAEFLPEGRLYERPLAPLDECLKQHGVAVSKRSGRIMCSGKLRHGNYELSGDVSSQYISGLLMALPLISGQSSLTVTGKIESKKYIEMTEELLRLSGVSFDKTGCTYVINGNQTPKMPDGFVVEGDYSSASFFLCMGALSDEGVRVEGLNAGSSQGDKAVLDILSEFGAVISRDARGVTVRRGDLKGITIDASQIPDIIPPLCVVAAAADGKTKVINAARLRLKESDRIRSTVAMLRSLGASARELDDGIIVNGGGRLSGGEVDPFGDHRIAMSAAVASIVSDGKIIIKDSECVAKSYPGFWDDFARLNLQPGGEMLT